MQGAGFRRAYDSSNAVGQQQVVNLFFTLVTGPRWSLSLKLSDTRVYEPRIRARLGTTAHLAPGAYDSFNAVGQQQVLSDTMYLLISFRKSTPHKIVNLLFTITNKNIKLTVLWGS